MLQSALIRLLARLLLPCPTGTPTWPKMGVGMLIESCKVQSCDADCLLPAQRHHGGASTQTQQACDRKSNLASTY